jgi:hypothetical protein
MKKCECSTSGVDTSQIILWSQKLIDDAHPKAK